LINIARFATHQLPCRRIASAIKKSSRNVRIYPGQTSRKTGS